MKHMECDFCSEPNPTWTFRASTWFKEHAIGNDIHYIDHGDGWAACDVCALLIRRNEPIMLRERSIAQFQHYDLQLKNAPLQLLREFIALQHAGFWSTKLDNGIRNIPSATQQRKA